MKQSFRVKSIMKASMHARRMKQLKNSVGTLQTSRQKNAILCWGLPKMLAQLWLHNGLCYSSAICRYKVSLGSSSYTNFPWGKADKLVRDLKQISSWEILRSCVLMTVSLGGCMLSLAIEKGRWSRTKRENRLCGCGSVQTVHVDGSCERTEAIRIKYPENIQAYQLK